jgi:GNAT superfamily N-acetyltransferase
MSRVAGDDRARALALMERVLRGGAPLAPEYPLCFGERASGRVLTISEEGAVVSACALLVRDFLAAGAQVRCGLIGSVCTDPGRRGRGLASALLARAERELAQEGCLTAMLWADDARFYEARGWRELGAEVDFVLPPAYEGRLPGARGIRAAAPDDWPAIHRLYETHRERVERSRDETAALLRGPGIETLVLQRSRDVVAYSCRGRGADFGATVHEWAGADADVIALVREHMQRARIRGERSPTSLITPTTARGLHDRLRGCGVAWSEGVLALGKLLDPHAAAALLGALAGPEARVRVESEIGRGAGGCEVTLEGPRGREELEAGELLEVLLPARGRRARIEELERASGLALSALPLPLFAWGLDSI